MIDELKRYKYPTDFKLFRKFCDWPFNVNYNKQGKCQYSSSGRKNRKKEYDHKMANAYYIMYVFLYMIGNGQINM